jgi:hypothetical protein
VRRAPRENEAKLEIYSAGKTARAFFYWAPWGGGSRLGDAGKLFCEFMEKTAVFELIIQAG